MKHNLNAAQQLHAAFIGLDVDFYTAETAKIATEQTREMASSYKAPHAYRGTAKRLHKGRIGSARLFKGHRT